MSASAARDSRALISLLADARARTLLLVESLTDRDLRSQHDPLMSPIVWDLGHIARFEELWLIRNLDGSIEATELAGMFDPFAYPRRERGGLPLPSKSEALALLADVRCGVLQRLEAGAFDEHSPLLAENYAYHMVAQHEQQHQETILQTLQLKLGDAYAPPRDYSIPHANLTLEPGAMVHFPGGEVPIGTDDRSAAYDNERPRHLVQLAPFWIDAAPVTNGEYAAFIEETGAESPLYWTRRAGEWWTRSMDRSGPIDSARPVCHVSWHEASAYAHWAGKRLPTELEWEAAASWDPAAATQRSYPWGETEPCPNIANVDQLAFDAAPVGAYPENVSAIGCHGMIGGVWEWTASDFGPWPGFESFPYAGYSEIFFGPEYKVLRGGSWATRPGAIRNTFRNWDYPIRRQIFSGFRCARDA